MLNNYYITAFPVSVQNGSMHQKDSVHDNDFEPYLTGQSNQVRYFGLVGICGWARGRSGCCMCLHVTEREKHSAG